MSNYEPQVGDRVRRTYWDGTVLEGVIDLVQNGWGESKSGVTLRNKYRPEETELLERPFKLNAEPGTVYGDPGSITRRVVRVSGGWLGYNGEEDPHWYEDEDITKLINEAGWVEYNLDGSRKND